MIDGEKREADDLEQRETVVRDQPEANDLKKSRLGRSRLVLCLSAALLLGFFLGGLLELQARLEEDAKELNKKAKEMKGKDLDLSDFNREIQETEQLLTQVSRRAEWMQILLERSPQRVEKFGDAVIEEGP